MLERNQLKQWTPEAVRKALSEAYRVLNAIEGRVGHKRLKAAMPEFELEYKRPMKARLRPSSIEIDQMYIALIGHRHDGADRPALLNGRLLADPQMHGSRAILIAACYGASLRYSARQMAERVGMPESSFRWHRDRAAAIVAEELNVAGVAAW